MLIFQLQPYHMQSSVYPYILLSLKYKAIHVPVQGTLTFIIILFMCDFESSRESISY